MDWRSQEQDQDDAEYHTTIDIAVFVAQSLRIAQDEGWPRPAC